MATHRIRHHPKLRLEALEDRAVPASAAFADGTLTVTAGENETITIAPIPGQLAGHLVVSDGSAAPVFTSAGGGLVVQNLVVRFADVAQGALRVQDGVGLDGNLVIHGARARTDVDLAGSVTVGNDLRFRGAGVGNDTISTGPNLFVGHIAAFNLGGGTNALTLGGGTVTRLLSVTGGEGDDTVTVSDGVLGGSALEVRGLTVALGDGFNTCQGDGTLPLVVRNVFRYTGGRNADVVRFHNPANDAELSVGLDAIISLGRAVGGATNELEVDRLTVGRNALVTGGRDTDDVTIHGASSVGGHLAVRLGGGANAFTVGYGLAPLTVGRNLTYTGRGGDDAVSIGATTVTGHMTVGVGGATGTGQHVWIGNSTAVFDSLGQLVEPTVTVGFSAAVRGGVGADDVRLDYLTVQRRLTVSTGAGDDHVAVSEAVVTRQTRILLGAGRDTLVADPVLTGVGSTAVRDAGWDLAFIRSLLIDVATWNLPPGSLGDLVTHLLGCDATPAGLLALVDDLTGIGLDATDLGVLLDCLGASSVLDLVACLTTIDIDTVDLVTLLEDVLALDVPKLLADVTALLTGTPHAGLITPLFNALMSPAVQQLLAEATGFGLPTHWVADLLNDLSALDLVVAELADLLLGLEGLGVDSAALAAVLRTLAGFDLLAIVPGTDLGGVLTGLSTNPATPSRFERFVVLAGAGEDRVVLGELPAGAEFTGVVRLYGGRDTDTLSASPRNQYRAGPNTEDFEAGSF